MKVGVVTTSYPRFPDDPAGNFVGEHVRALRNLGHEVEVIAAGDDRTRAIDHHRTRDGLGRDIESGLERDIERGLQRDVVRVPNGGLFYTGGAPDLLEREPRRALSAAMFTIRLTAAILRRRFDSIVAHWLAPSALACVPTTAPLLAIAHGGDVHTLRRANLLAPALHLLRARDAQLVFVSEELRALSIEGAPRLASWLATARVQPMGIDLARFAAIPRTPTDPPTLVMASRLVPIKGVDVAIAALAHVKHRVRLVIAGDGPERASLWHAALTQAPVLERPANSAPVVIVGEHVSGDLANSIEFLGEIDTRARDRLLGTASIVLVPSRTIGSSHSSERHRTQAPASNGNDRAPGDPRNDSNMSAVTGRSEGRDSNVSAVTGRSEGRDSNVSAVTGRSEGTPLIALEALAAGIPVIASAVGGLRSLRGVELVPPDDPRALAEAIDRVLDAPPSAQALRESVAHLDWRHVIGTLVRNP